MPRLFFREGQRLLLRAMHLLGTRTVFVVCLLFALTTAFSSVRTLWFSFSGRVTEGLVVRQQEELVVDWRQSPAAVPNAPIQTANASRLYRAVVAFQDGGRRFEVLAKASSTSLLYPTGTKVDVVYPPGQPGRAQLRPELPEFWTQASVLLMATVLGAGTAYIWWTESRRRATRRRRVVKSVP